MNTKLFIAAACAVFASQTRAADLTLPKDGWAAWQVEAVDNAPAFCCYEWDNKHSTPATCKLDGVNHGYGSNDHAKTDSVRVYAKFEGGKVQKLRALDAACPVEAKSPIQKLENVSTDDSARWLAALVKQTSMAKGDMGDDVFAALGLHRGDIALTALSDSARNGKETEERKRAIFWLSQLRGEPGAKVTSEAMFADSDSEIRKHAAFAIAQTKLPLATASLVRQGKTDKDADVRAQAWFWLAQTGVADAEGAITKALNTDADDHVREQAVFALSQLPDDRAPKALMMVAQDRTLSKEQRKRALFWLGQSESPEAAAYLDKVLMGNVSSPN